VQLLGDGREIVFSDRRKLMAVEVKVKDALEAGEPRALLQLPPDTEVWDVTPDHQRILIGAKAAEEKPVGRVVRWSRGGVLVTDWAAEIRK
jgi:hypothetical protein